MKNITIAVPDEVYRAARVRAAEEGTSVSALVTRYLRTISGESEEFRRLEELGARTLAELRAAGVRIRAADRLGRDEVHDRAALR